MKGYFGFQCHTVFRVEFMILVEDVTEYVQSLVKPLMYTPVYETNTSLSEGRCVVGKIDGCREES